MRLTESQVERIKKDVLSRGVTMPDLADSLVDHICCAIENSAEDDFDQAYAGAMEVFGHDEIQKIQKKTTYLLTLKQEIVMKKTMYIMGYIAAFLSTTGLLFKLQHWTGGAIILTLGIGLLNVGFLPMYFYDRYKKAVN